MKRKTFYYSDLLNDDFANTKINNKPLGAKFKYYSNNFFAKMRKFIVYRIIVEPIVFFYLRLIANVKFVNTKVMKPYKKQACFLYGNHTSYVHDAFHPSYLSFPRRADIVVNSDAVNIKGIRWLVMDIGGVPIPSDLANMQKFNNALEHYVREKHWITVYPEAHIWPYYTQIRPFTEVSFHYPVRFNAPVFTFTQTYQKRKFGFRPKRIVYVDGPFFPDQTLSSKQAQQKLRDEVYQSMCNSAQNSTYSAHDYVYRQKDGQES